MSQYKLSDITTPFWATNDGFKGGRDPMGIQNSSVATYGRLLPGLTNLTGHIRYYSLYCWLISEYKSLKISGKTDVHQYNFIRRAELAMALIMKDQNIGSVVGALFVSQQRYKLIEEGVYNLADGADYNSKDKYWTYQTGAFGQYYLGSLIYYNLVKIEEGWFYLLSSGDKLASAVRKSVDKDIRDLFIDRIIKGSLSDNDINILNPLGLHKLSRDTAEWESLNHLLTKPDDENSMRRETVLLMLKDIENGIIVDRFVEHRFMNVNQDIDNDAAFGWYFYYLCEAFHFCIESIFCYILNEISDLHNPAMKFLIEDIRENTLSYLEEEKKYHSMDEWKENIDGKIEDMFNDLKKHIREKDYPQAAVQSLKLMLRLQLEFEMNKEDILDFENRNDLTRQRGILSEGLKSYITVHSSLSIEKYIETIVYQIMQEHTIIAIGKMGNNDNDLRKFVHEDGRIVLVEIRYPTETSPRVNSLYNFLVDLNYIDSEGKLTDIAYNYIRSYGND